MSDPEDPRRPIAPPSRHQPIVIYLPMPHLHRARARLPSGRGPRLASSKSTQGKG